MTFAPVAAGLNTRNAVSTNQHPTLAIWPAYMLPNTTFSLNSRRILKRIRRAGQLVVQTLDLVEAMLSPGITTDAINTLVHDFTLKNKATPAPLNYRGFPKSVCTSVNEVICHGIPSDRLLVDGDIINVDVTTILDGYYADANKTYFIGIPDQGCPQDRSSGP